jgi:hypothetical protein
VLDENLFESWLSIASIHSCSLASVLCVCRFGMHVCWVLVEVGFVAETNIIGMTS